VLIDVRPQLIVKLFAFLRGIRVMLQRGIELGFDSLMGVFCLST
jgi:hypothetical protein